MSIFFLCGSIAVEDAAMGDGRRSMDRLGTKLGVGGRESDEDEQEVVYDVNDDDGCALYDRGACH